MRIGVTMRIAFAALAALLAGCAAKHPPLAVGDLAPKFSLPGSDGKRYDSVTLGGKFVVLAWFPKAFTSG